MNLKFAVICSMIFIIMMCGIALGDIKPANHNGLYLGFGVGFGSGGFSPDNSNIN